MLANVFLKQSNSLSAIFPNMHFCLTTDQEHRYNSISVFAGIAVHSSSSIRTPSTFKRKYPGENLKLFLAGFCKNPRALFSTCTGGMGGVRLEIWVGVVQMRQIDWSLFFKIGHFVGVRKKTNKKNSYINMALRWTLFFSYLLLFFPRIYLADNCQCENSCKKSCFVGQEPCQIICKLLVALDLE